MVAAAHANGAHWRLVGPWYRWPRPALPQDGRDAMPSIQKFAGNDFVTAFLANPQHSLKYDPVIDVVNNHDLVAAGSSMAGKVATLFALNSSGAPVKPDAPGPKFRTRLAPSSLRKLYQPTHDRHYIVTCELHCDEPGFPHVLRQRVCQAGFVMRRRRSLNPKNISASQIETHVATVRSAEADLYELEVLAVTSTDPNATAGLRNNAQKRMLELAASATPPTWDGLIAQKRKDLANGRTALQAWYKSNDITVAVDGWFPQPGGTGANARGEWKALSDEQQTADVAAGEQPEQVYPLFPVIPDPRDLHHDAAGRTIYYGVIPTGDLQHDTSGKPHFDDVTTYEMRCFVRAHHPCPPRVGKTPDCHGALTWSRSSEAFRLAAPFDVLGASNRPITIKMPDLKDLAAQAAMRPRGKLSPVRFIQPQHLSPQVKGGTASPDSSAGGEAICSFSIPLITIIALFVLNLFLPIVVFIFQLWFLLVFRFCIPPQISASAGVDAALAVTPPSIDLDVDIGIEVSGVEKTAAELNALLSAAMGSHITQDTGYDEAPDLTKLSNNALGPLDQSFVDAASLQPNPDGSLPPPPEVSPPLVYEDKVTPVWPAAGAVK